VTNSNDCIDLLRKGESNRKIRQTSVNIQSSRSHEIFQLLIESNTVDERGMMIKSKLNLCDLAGSEKIKYEKNINNEHLEELKRINLSLSTLCKVISALSSNKPQNYVPYRESKLTRLLKDSIGGNTQTIIIATIAPFNEYLENTLSTLKFAEKARKVTVNAKVNEISSDDQAIIKKLQYEVNTLKHLLLQTNNGRNIDNLSKEIEILKKENESLKSKLSKQEIESLMMENKKLRLEYQQSNIPNKSIMESDNNTQVFITENVATNQNPNSPKEVTNKPITTKPNILNAGTIVYNHHKKEIIERKNEIHLNENGNNRILFMDKTNNYQLSQPLKNINSKSIPSTFMLFEQLEQGRHKIEESLPREGRCPKCTLKIPCKHFRNIDEIVVNKGPEKKENPRFENNLNSLYKEIQINHIDDLKISSNKENNNSISMFDRKINRLTNVNLNNIPYFRIRSKERTCQINTSHSEEKEKFKIKKAEQKLKVMEQIREYKEMKYNSCLQKKIEEEKKKEIQFRKELEKDRLWRAYHEKQKNKLEEYKRKQEKELNELYVKVNKRTASEDKGRKKAFKNLVLRKELKPLNIDSDKESSFESQIKRFSDIKNYQSKTHEDYLDYYNCFKNSSVPTNT